MRQCRASSSMSQGRLSSADAIEQLSRYGRLVAPSGATDQYDGPHVAGVVRQSGASSGLEPSGAPTMPWVIRGGCERNIRAPEPDGREHPLMAVTVNPTTGDK